MTSWRDTSSVQAQQDFQALIDVALSFAQQQLATRGSFFPYAAAIGTDGEVELISAVPDPGNDNPLAADVAAACFGALSDKREDIRAGSVTTDVTMSGGGEAIRVDVEHAEGKALAILLPYTRKRLSKRIDYGQIRAQAGQRQIWA